MQSFRTLWHLLLGEKETQRGRGREREKEDRNNAIDSGHYIPATSFSVKNHYTTKPLLEEI
jgi:hypothetical protein